ncbi:MAG: hypothetical protein HYV35_02920 [Lentisphaerae bacterium]|nr:hypothetical protein [Lentisphaerota bacterium]
MAREIKCKSLALRLDEHGRAVSLRHRKTGYEFLGSQSNPVGLWQLGLIKPVSWSDPLPPIEYPELSYAGHEWWTNRNEYKGDLALDSNYAPAPTIAGDETQLALEWHLAVPGGTARVILEVKGGQEKERLEIRAQVAVPGNWALKRVTYPRLRGFGDRAAPADDALLLPKNWGILRQNPLEDMTNFAGQHPGGANWCQMIAWLHGASGLYIGMLDPDTNHTGIDAQYVEENQPVPWNTEPWYPPDQDGQPAEAEWAPLSERLAAGRAPAIQLRCNHWPAMINDWICSYPVILQGFTGAWYESAQIHRKWAIQQRWCRRGRLAERARTSDALANLDLWFSGYGFPPASLQPKPAWEFQKAMQALLEFFKMPFGAHWYNWHNFSWHRNFPGHTPAVEGFKQVSSELQSRGIVIMPYCQGRLLYRDRPTFAQERTHASVEANGQPYLEMYTPNDDWPLALCPGDQWSQRQWLETAEMLWRQYDVDGVYFDQITAMRPSLCYHAGHGHPLGGGTQYFQGYDQALAAMRPCIEEKPRRFLSSESLSDAFMDRIDLYLSFVPSIEDYVPLFTAIYGGYTTVMGRSCPSAVMENLPLFAMVQGEQFLFGGQLGWTSAEILQHHESAVFLRDLAILRSRVRRFLHFGSMEPPLAAEVAGPKISALIPAELCARSRPLRLERQAIRNTVWRGPDGRPLVLLLNESSATASISFPSRAGWSQYRWHKWTLGRHEAEPILMDKVVTLTVPALTAVALEAE